MSSIITSHLSQNEVLAEFEDAAALLNGHFVLSSGLHSANYLQCARVLMDARRADRLCSALAKKISVDFADQPIELVVSPAMGGVIVGYEMGRQLGLPSVFTERVDGELALRRGFDIPEGTRVFMMEDIVTTGKSSRECVDVINHWGGQVVAAGCLINRKADVDLGVPLYCLAQLDIPTYAADALPPELAALPVVKPGSRFLQKETT